MFRRCVSFYMGALACALASLGGCASDTALRGTTASLSDVVRTMTTPANQGANASTAWEDAVIAQAIAAHEMRNP